MDNYTIKKRQMLIEAIEAKVGTLLSIDWHKVTLEDMIKLHAALYNY